MKNVLMAYYSHAGHTSRIARTIRETIIEAGHGCDTYELIEICREGISWEKYDIVITGCPIVYGFYHSSLWEYIRLFQDRLEERPHSFFNVTVVSRTPAKALPEGNRYLQRFLQKSPWKPRDIKCFAGKVDYPNWTWYQTLAIQFIMALTQGPTDRNATVDFTDWDDVRAYALHCLTLDELQRPQLERPLYRSWR